MTDAKTTTPPYELTDRYTRDRGQVFLTGIQALARIPVEQLRRDRQRQLNTAALLAGYPGSPLGGFDQEIARAIGQAPDLPIEHRPAVNEELGATAVMGSQLAAARPDARFDGVVGMWYGKAPGLDRAGDALRHGVFAGSSPNGGAVVLVGDDPACKSSTMPSSSDATLVDLHMPILYPGTTAECLELGLHAVALSRATGLWSSLKIVTSIADGSGTVTLPVVDKDPVTPTLEVDGRPWRNTPSAMFLGQRMIDVEREFREIRLPLAVRYGIENGLNRVTVDPADAWLGLVATGFTYYQLLESLRRLGLDSVEAIAGAGIRLLHLRMPVPFDSGLVRHFARGLDEIVVVEEKNPTLEWLIKDALYGGGDQPLVLGKADEQGVALMPSWGQLDADAITPGLRRRLATRLADRLTPEPPPIPERQLIPLSVNRTPFFCSGCPHNWGTKVPEGSLVSAGTGCHGMSLLMDPERVGDGIGTTAMGNEGAQWIGMAPFVDTDHIFQNYGDGTFFHSAQLALQYCIGAGMHMTFKILYNHTVAMTGGQDASNLLGVPDLARILLSYGASKVVITADDPDRYRGVELPDGVRVHDRTEMIAVQERLRETPGVTVLIHDQECAAELRRARKRGRVATPTRRVVINHRICEGCGDCGDVSNCLSVQPVETPLGRKTTIDQHSCNYDESCLLGDCPAFMTVDVAAGSPPPLTPAPVAPFDVPEPEAMVKEAAVRLRMAGVGGTGVVTAAQIVGTAAMLDGWATHGLDQTGLSQKAGPVISDVVLVPPGGEASNIVGRGQADVLIGFDAMVAASDAAIGAVTGATAIVASTHQTPTGRMIAHPELDYPAEEIEARLASRGGQRLLADTTRLTEALAGQAAAANVFLLGVAVQAGHLPVGAEAIRRAIDLNGVQVEANRAAFEWGRCWVADPDRVESIAVEGRSVAPTAIFSVPPLPGPLKRQVAALSLPEPVAELVETLAADLCGYQSAAYAAELVDHVATAAEAEGAVGEVGPLTIAVARSFHKLMAYKDEYEVARLFLSPEGQASVEAVGGPGASATWHIHPPFLRALGRKGKVSLGPWARPAMRALAAGRRLRGTALDPFGRAEVRVAERSLPAELAQAMASVYQHLDAEHLDDAVAIANLADTIRGYEDLKLRRIESFRSTLAAAVDNYCHPGRL
jgi:indolepyruvate ferredoxin oxidoreductase